LISGNLLKTDFNREKRERRESLCRGTACRAQSAVWVGGERSEPQRFRGRMIQKLEKPRNVLIYSLSKEIRKKIAARFIIRHKGECHEYRL
jgi:hypothetical protein